MTRRDKVFYTKLLLLFLGIVSLLIFFYTLKLREVIERNILFNITEVAQHDKRALRASIELFLEELSGVEKRLAVQGASSIRDLEAQLNLEAATTAFTRLFMLAEDGRIFTDRFLIYDRANESTGARFDFLQLLEGSDRRSTSSRRAMIYKGFMNDRFSISLNVNDIFHSSGANSTLYTPLRILHSCNKSDTNIGITLRYKFNVLKNNYRGKGAGNEQKLRL